LSQSRKPLPGNKALRNWDERAGVRSEPRRLITGPGELGKAFFPENLIPHLGHPLVDPGDQRLRRYLAAQHLYQWLSFTMHFEVAVVCRAAQLIAEGKTGFSLSPAARLDAARIVVDESYHSLYSLDVLQQLEAHSGMTSLGFDFGPLLARLDCVGADMPEYRTLVQLLQVVVFETLITSILSDMPNDDSLIPVVRATVRDHAIDEGRHHAFFAAFFQHMWSQLDPAVRSDLARYLPRLIVQSLQPPTGPARAALRAAGFPERIAGEIIADSYSPDAVLAGINRSAAKTLQLFARLGVLDVPGARDAFLAYGLAVS
jgi:hypothetical protein